MSGIVLNAFIYSSGHHEASWRHPLTRPEQIYDVSFYREIARIAEDAKFDAIFLADSPSLRAGVEFNAAGRLEPIVVLTAIAAATERIGLIATASTTYYEPYNLARLLSTLDHLSAGRAGWNIVTTDSALAAANFGVPAHPDAEQRYARAREFTDAVIGLWDSWRDDAILLDRERGRYADPARIRPIDFAGEHIRVRGPLNIPRSPQGNPVLVQAGSSNQGRDFAARYGEVIFTAHQQLADARRFYADIKSRVRAAGRDPEHVKVLPGVSPFIAETPEQARQLMREFDELITPSYGLSQIQAVAGVDLSGIDLDSPVPAALFADSGDVVDNARSRRQLVAAIVERERPTVRALIHRMAGARGHRVVVGTPQQIADDLHEWVRADAADGFNIMPPYLPGGLEVFTRTVVPILRERGLFRSDYTGTTLREHLGLPRPAGIMQTSNN